MSQVEDMEAINAYMKKTAVVNPEAQPIKDSFMSWYPNIGFWDKNYSTTTYDEARTRRNQFNLKNVRNAAELEQVQNVLATGQTTEQMAGGTRPPINITTGAVGTQVKKPTAPFLPITGGGGEKLNRVLALGMRGDDVSQWQKFLGITPVTGYYGQYTVDKTSAYQRAEKLKVDGKVGEETWEHAFPAKDTTSVIVTAKDAEAIKEATVPVKDAIKLVAEKKPVPRVKPKTKTIYQLHKEGDKLTAKELDKHNSRAGSTWHLGGTRTKPEWVIIEPKVASAPKPPAKKPPTQTAPKKEPAKVPPKTPAKETGKVASNDNRGKKPPIKKSSEPKKRKEKEVARDPEVMQAGMFSLTSPLTWALGALIAGGAAVALHFHGDKLGPKYPSLPPRKVHSLPPYEKKDEKKPLTA